MVVVVSGERPASAPPRHTFLRTMSCALRSSETLCSGSFLVEKRQQKLISDKLRDVVVSTGSRIDVVRTHWLRFVNYVPKDPLPVLPAFGESDGKSLGIMAMARLNRKRVEAKSTHSGSGRKSGVFQVVRRQFSPDEFDKLQNKAGKADAFLVEAFRDRTFRGTHDVANTLEDRLHQTEQSAQEDPTFQCHMKSLLASAKARLNAEREQTSESSSTSVESSVDSIAAEKAGLLPVEKKIRVRAMAYKAASHALLTSSLMVPQKTSSSSRCECGPDRSKIQMQRAQILKSITVPALTLDGLHRILTFFGVTTHSTSERVFALLATNQTVEFSNFFNFISALEQEDLWCERSILRTVVHNVLGSCQKTINFKSLENDLWSTLNTAEQIRLKMQRHRISAVAEALHAFAFHHTKDFDHLQHAQPEVFKLFVRFVFPLARNGAAYMDEELQMAKKKMRTWGMDARIANKSVRAQRGIIARIHSCVCAPFADVIRVARRDDEMRCLNEKRVSRAKDKLKTLSIMKRTLTPNLTHHSSLMQSTM